MLRYLLWTRPIFERLLNDATVQLLKIIDSGRSEIGRYLFKTWGLDSGMGYSKRFGRLT